MIDHNTAMVNPLWKLEEVLVKNSHHRTINSSSHFFVRKVSEENHYMKISTQALPAIPVVRIGERIIFNFLILEVVPILCHDSFPSSDE
jgi:hypothetical protein